MKRHPREFALFGVFANHSVFGLVRSDRHSSPPLSRWGWLVPPTLTASRRSLLDDYQDLVMVGSTKSGPAQAFLVTSREITEASQLKGKKVGVSRIGASSDFLLWYILKRLGLVPEKDVSIIQVGSAPIRVAAIHHLGAWAC